MHRCLSPIPPCVPELVFLGADAKEAATFEPRELSRMPAWGERHDSPVIGHLGFETVRCDVKTQSLVWSAM